MSYKRRVIEKENQKILCKECESIKVRTLFLLQAEWWLSCAKKFFLYSPLEGLNLRLSSRVYQIEIRPGNASANLQHSDKGLAIRPKASSETGESLQDAGSVRDAENVALHATANINLIVLTLRSPSLLVSS